MARLLDLPRMLRRIGPLTFFKRVLAQIIEDDIFTLGAALAYSWLFALFPFLVFLLSLVPLLPDRFKPNVEQNVREMFNGKLTDKQVDSVTTEVTRLMQRTSGKGLLSTSLLIAIWAASAGMARTMYALDRAYDIEKGRKFYSRRLIAVALTLVVATLIVLVLILLPVGTAVLNWLLKQEGMIPGMYILVNIGRYFLSLLLMFAVLAIIYHFGPSARQRFAAFSPGAIFCVAVWVLLGWAFRKYLVEFGGAENYAKTYGAVAGAAILLLFFYVDALVLLIGAEINSEIDFAVHGTRTAPAVRKAK